MGFDPPRATWASQYNLMGPFSSSSSSSPAAVVGPPNEIIQRTDIYLLGSASTLEMRTREEADNGSLLHIGGSPGVRPAEGHKGIEEGPS